MEPTDDQPPPTKGIPIETGALNALRFYQMNYDTPVFTGLGAGKKKIVLGAKPFECRFCAGKPPRRTFRKQAHAVSELLGNKIMESLYECDDCNERFSAFEDDLGKMTKPFRSVGGVKGKRGVPTLVGTAVGTSRQARMEVRDGTLAASHEAGDGSFVVDDVAKTITFSYVQDSYRPLGAYKALCKSAFTLFPQSELGHFSELKDWLLEKDVETRRVYSNGSHICFRTFVSGFRPFPQPIVALLRRKALIDAPYMSMFIAFGNISYQIFVPCPAMDGHLSGKTVSFAPYPHLFQLQPWRVPGPIQSHQIDLSASERTTSRSGTMRWVYERMVRVP